MSPISGICLLAGLFVAAFWDLRTMRIPRWLLWVMGLAWLGPWQIKTAGHVISAGFIAFIMVATRYGVGRRDEMPALGSGDVWLMALVGLYLGWEAALGVLLMACLFALMEAWLLPKLGWREPAGAKSAIGHGGMAGVVPFAPAIALGCLIVLVIGRL